MCFVVATMSELILCALWILPILCTTRVFPLNYTFNFLFFLSRYNKAWCNLEFWPGHNGRQTAQRDVNPFCQLCSWSRLAVQKKLCVFSCLFPPPCLPLVVKQPSLLKGESLSRHSEVGLVAKHILHGCSRVSHRGPAATRRPTLSLLYVAFGWNSLWNISSFHQFSILLSVALLLPPLFNHIQV